MHRATDADGIQTLRQFIVQNVLPTAHDYQVWTYQKAARERSHWRRGWIIVINDHLRANHRLCQHLMLSGYIRSQSPCFGNDEINFCYAPLIQAVSHNWPLMPPAMQDLMPLICRYWNFTCSPKVLTALANFTPQETQTIQTWLQHLKNVNLMMQWQAQHQKVSKALPFMTKKHIKADHSQVMQHTPLLKYFHMVELDNDVDLAKFNHFSKLLEETLPQLPPVHHPLALRLRKIRNYHAAGIYFPHFHNIVLDFRDFHNTNVNGVNSFIHEYGHALDDDHAVPLSLQPDFQPLLTTIQQQLQTLTLTNLNYYLTPTEVFARCFEFYWAITLHHTELVSPQAYYRTAPVYRILLPYQAQIAAYFRHVLAH